MLALVTVAALFWLFAVTLTPRRLCGDGLIVRNFALMLAAQHYEIMIERYFCCRCHRLLFSLCLRLAHFAADVMETEQSRKKV